MENVKMWYKSKTFWFNAITIIIGIIQVVSQTFPIPQELLGLILGLGNLFLRTLTDKPLGFKK